MSKCPLIVFVALLTLPILSTAARPERIGRVAGDLTSLTTAPGQRVLLADRTNGRRNLGRILELNKNQLTVLHSFRGYDGANPSKLITVRRTTYGITPIGGRHNNGVLFQLTRTSFRILHHFTEDEGYPVSLKSHGSNVYGATIHGTFAKSGRSTEFTGTTYSGDVAQIGNTSYFLQDYSDEILAFRTGDLPVTVAKGNGIYSTNVAWLPSRNKIVGVSTSGGPFRYGSVHHWKPGAPQPESLFDFQSFNGGYPRAAAISPRGALYTANAEGIWQIGKRPKKISTLPASALHFAGRNLYVISSRTYSETEIWLIRDAR